MSAFLHDSSKTFFMILDGFFKLFFIMFFKTCFPWYVYDSFPKLVFNFYDNFRYDGFKRCFLGGFE